MYSNPAKEQLTIQLESQWKGEVEISLMDLSAKNLYQSMEQLQAGRSNKLQMSLTDFPKGMYQLHLINLNTQQKQVYKLMRN
ncbi:MAG: T9SS type A sorting domain-containing protein [Cyclobacteriaceae bacterium]